VTSGTGGTRWKKNCRYLLSRGEAGELYPASGGGEKKGRSDPRLAKKGSPFGPTDRKGKENPCQERGRGGKGENLLRLKKRGNKLLN